MNEMTYKKYPKYKDSGIEWLNEIPEGWEMKRVKHLFKISKEESDNKDATLLSLTQQGIKVRDITIGEGQWAESYDNYRKIRRGDIVLNPMDLISGFIDLSDREGIISPAYTTLRAKEEFCLRYFAYFFQKHYFERIFFKFGEGVSVDHRWTLKNDELLNFSVLIPSHEEQKQIAECLDQKTEKIDSLISKNNKLIDLLEEYRQALISHTVTKGLDPNAKMKDSGIKWLGEIPDDWKVRKLRTLGIFSASGIDKKEKENEEQVLMVNYTDVYGNSLRELKKDNNYMKTTAVSWKKIEHSLKKGDVLFTPSSETVKEIGESAVIMEDLPNIVYSYHLIRFRPNNETYIKFRKYLCNNHFVLEQFAYRAKGTTRMILNHLDFKDTEAILPPKETQKKIANFLDKKTGKIDNAIEKLQSQNNYLKEYRQSLISNAVTGKIKI